MDGITFEELTGFKETSRNVMRGRLMGLDITICDYDALESLGIDDNYYLDVDIDYFIEVPSDRLWIDPSIVIDRIRSQLGEPSLVTISRAVSSGFTPVTFRYLGDYIYSQLNDSKVAFDYYHKLNTAILDLGNGHLVGASQACEQLIEDEPELAAAYFILGICASEVKQKNLLFDEAGRRDAGYRFDLSREAIGLLHRKKSITTDKLRELMAAFESLEMEPPQRQLAEVALAQVLGATGNSTMARSLLDRQTGDYAEHDEVLLSIVVGQLADATLRAENKRLLRSICSSEKNATIATVYLGDLEFSEQNYQVALEHYRMACNRAQAWMLPLERMSACYAKLGMNGKAADIEAEISTRRQRLEIVVGETGKRNP
jgi:tetratricopeptide (TPR) repeat protein